MLATDPGRRMLSTVAPNRVTRAWQPHCHVFPIHANSPRSSGAFLISPAPYSLLSRAVANVEESRFCETDAFADFPFLLKHQLGSIVRAPGCVSMDTSAQSFAYYVMKRGPRPREEPTRPRGNSSYYERRSYPYCSV